MWRLSDFPMGRTYSERIFSNMRFSFSLNFDESTSNNNKKVGLISNYWFCFCFSVCPLKCNTLTLCFIANNHFYVEDPLHAGLLLSCRVEEGGGGAFPWRSWRLVLLYWRRCSTNSSGKATSHGRTLWVCWWTHVLWWGAGRPASRPGFTNIVPTCWMLMETPAIIFTMQQRNSQSPLTATWRSCLVISRLTISGVQTR